MHRYCVTSGIAAPLLVILGMVQSDAAGLLFAVAALVASGWLSMVCWRLVSAPLTVADSA